MKQLLTEYYQLTLSPEQHASILNEAVDSKRDNKPMIINKVLLQRKESKNRNGRIYPGAILEREIEKYNDTFVKTRRALGELDHCFTSNVFDVLTFDGWKPFSEVKVGEEVLSYNIHTKNLEYKKVLKVVNNEFSGDVYRIKGRHIDTEVTGNHKFILRDRYGNEDFYTVKEIFENRTKFNKHQIIKTGEFTSPNSTEITLKGHQRSLRGMHKYTDDFNISTKTLSGVLGIWLAEGHIAEGKGCTVGQVCISQNYGEKFDKIDSLLKSSGLEYYVYHKDDNAAVFRIKNHQLYDYVKDLGDKYTKRIPTEVKNFDKESLTTLLEYFNLGDGRNQDGIYGNRKNVFTVSKGLIDDLQECLIKSGKSGNLTIAHKKGYSATLRGRKITATTDLHQLNFSKVNGIYLDERFVSIEKRKYEGDIHCLEVEDNHSFCVRQNNKYFITGNCDQMVINLKNVSHLITEIWWEGNDVYGNLEILNGPEFPAGRIMAGLLERRIPVGISSRGLGSIDETNEGSIVQDDFSLLCFDAVSFESTQGSNMSLQEGMSHSLINHSLLHYNKIDEIIHEMICLNSGVCSCMFK